MSLQTCAVSTKIEHSITNIAVELYKSAPDFDIKNDYKTAGRVAAAAWDLLDKHHDQSKGDKRLGAEGPGMNNIRREKKRKSRKEEETGGERGEGEREGMIAFMNY